MSLETSPGLEKPSFLDNLAPYQRHVVQEGRELRDRIGLLETFLGNGAPGASSAEQSAMYEQLSSMKKYYAALMERSILWVREGKVALPETSEEFVLPPSQPAAQKYGSGPCESCQ